MLEAAPRPARDRQRAAHAAVMRRARRRARNGVLMVTLPVSPEQTAKLAALHYLGEFELENRARIAAAIGAALDAIEIA